MRRLKVFHGLFEFAQRMPDRFRLALGASCFVGRSLHKTGNAPGILVMSL